MLVLLTLLTAGYFAAVVWVVRGKRRTRAEELVTVVEVGDLPAEDQPPPSAKGWPPAGRHFSTYVDEGFAALDAYLAKGFAA